MNTFGCSYGQQWEVVAASREFDLSLCFQESVLTPGACTAFVVIAVGWRIPRLLQKERKPLQARHKWAPPLKKGLSFLLAAALTMKLWDHFFRYGIDYLTSGALAALVQAVAFYVACAVHSLENKRSRSPSTLLCVFYLVVVVLQVFKARAIFADQQKVPRSDVAFYFLAVAIMLLLMIMEGFLSGKREVGKGDDLAPNSWPRDSESIFSRALFTWTWPMLQVGQKKYLDMSDMWALPESCRAKPNYDRFSWFYSAHAHKGESSAFDPLMVALIRTSGPALFKSVVTQILMQACNMATPLLVEQLIFYVTGSPGSAVAPSSGPRVTGPLIAAGFLVQAIAYALLANYNCIVCFTEGLIVRGTLMNAVYHKLLRLPSTRATRISGTIANLVNTDASAVSHLTWDLPNMILVPLQLLAFLTLLCLKFGVIGLIAIGLIMAVSGAVFFMARKAMGNQHTQLREMDKRIKLTSEVLRGIRVVKYYSWIEAMEAQIQALRDQEISALRSGFWIYALQATLATVVPSGLTLLTFAGVSALSSGPAAVTSGLAFAGISVLKLLANPLNTILNSFDPMLQGIVGYRRIAMFLREPELGLFVEGNVNADDGGNFSVVVENGSFSWQPQVTQLRLTDGTQVAATLRARSCTINGLNLTFERGSLVAVLAAVGHGKSSLLALLLGEMTRVEGVVRRWGTVAYVPQTPWIIHGTLRENICFGRDYDANRYTKVVEACALIRDFESLPFGDLTVLSDKGNNLSGGQRARVACARAVYADADIYMFDDTLSAVDAQVDQQLFQNVFMGLLKEKTRIFATNTIHHLPAVDRIVLLRRGKVLAQGSYASLLAGEAPHVQAAFTELVAAINNNKPSGATPVVTPVLSNEVIGSPEVHITSGYEYDEDSVDSERTIIPPPKRSTYLPRGAPDVGPGADPLEQYEKMQRGSVAWSVYAAYLRACGRRAFAALVALLIASAAISVSMQYVLGFWADASVPPERRTSWLHVYAGLMVVYLALTGGSYVFFYTRIAVRGAVRTSTTLLHRVLRLPASFFDVEPVGRCLNRFSKDQTVIDSQLPMLIMQYLISVLQLIGILVTILTATPWFAVLALPLALLFWKVQSLFLRSTRELQRLASVARSPALQHSSESLDGLMSIRAYACQQRFCAQFEAKLDLLATPDLVRININRWLGVNLQMISAMVTFGAALFAILAARDRSATLIGVSITSAQDMVWMLIALVRVYCDIETSVISVERICEYSELPSEKEFHTDHPLPQNWPNRGAIDFCGYSARYRPGLPLVLRSVTLSIRPGEKIGVVGRTGAGKTSLTQALFRMLEVAEGSIHIDGIDISALGLADLRERLLVLPQEPHIFSGTVRSNLDPRGQFSDAALWRAIDTVHLRDVIQALPDSAGLDTPLGSCLHVTDAKAGSSSAGGSGGGGSMSAGQTQLLCLARALLRKSRVLVLDEASACIDHGTDAALQATLRREFAGSTVLTIAHRIATVLDSDRVLVMDRGQVAEFEAPAMLLRNPNSLFRALVKGAGLTKTLKHV